MQTSLSALQRHYRTVKKHGDADLPAPEPALYQDALMGSETQEAFFAGPTHSCTGLFNYFEVSQHITSLTVCLLNSTCVALPDKRSPSCRQSFK